MINDQDMLSELYMVNTMLLNAFKFQYVVFENHRPIENDKQIHINDEKSNRIK
jgi:hypothetical protein